MSPKAVSKKTQVCILFLAAGYGTRLYPLTEKMAKPLVPINGKPMLNFLFDKIKCLDRSFPVKEIRLVVNNKFYSSFVEWEKQYGIRAQLLNDGSNSPDDRRGAVGDIQFGIGRASGDWLVLGGDNLFEDDLIKFVDFSFKNKPYPSIGLYDIHSKQEASRCGVVALDEKKVITKFQEKPKDPFSTLVASCVYFFPAESLGLLDKFVSQHREVDAAGTYIEWLIGQTNVFGYLLKGKWIDIGHFDSLKAAEQSFSADRPPSTCE